MAKASSKPKKTETGPEPDAWARFEKAIHKIAPPSKAKKKGKAGK